MIDFQFENILPYDGEAYYFGKIWSHQEANEAFETLLKTSIWKQDKIQIFGKHITTKRKVAWYGSEPFTYTYSRQPKTALPWTPELIRIVEIVENHTQETYNSCLLNLYHSGEEGMSWHNDNEPELLEHGPICSLSIGAERKFVFKHKISKEKISLLLEHGSLLLMKGSTQRDWLHALPKTLKVTQPRINLTFRTIHNKKEIEKTNIY